MRGRTAFVFLLVAVFVVQALADCSNYANAEPGCDRTCSRRCNPPPDCKNTCKPDSCRCKPGFRYNTDTYKCVRPEEC